MYPPVGGNAKNDQEMNETVNNIEMKSPRTNSTFGFCQHTKNQPRKAKRAIF